jgi:hypothetical protein
MTYFLVFCGGYIFGVFCLSIFISNVEVRKGEEP